MSVSEQHTQDVETESGKQGKEKTKDECATQCKQLFSTEFVLHRKTFPIM